MSNNIEEDIKIVEKIIDKCKQCKFATCEQCGISFTEVQAISNVLNNSKKNQKIVDKIEVKLNKLRENLSHYGDYKNLNILEKINVERTNAKIEILEEILAEE